MRSIKALAFAAVILASMFTVACSKNSTNPGGPQTYTQIERLARPAVKEAFEAYSRHDQTNRSSPFSDPILPGDINMFMTAVAGRDATTATFVQNVLIPDVMIADLSKIGVGPAYLGVESGGATGSLFGGRGLRDDVIKTDLGAIFGNTVAALSGHDDGKESPCLLDDNVPYLSTTKHDTSTFPYVGSPR